MRQQLREEERHSHHRMTLLKVQEKQLVDSTTAQIKRLEIDKRYRQTPSPSRTARGMMLFGTLFYSLSGHIPHINCMSCCRFCFVPIYFACW